MIRALVLYNDGTGDGGPGGNDQAWEGSKVRAIPRETEVLMGDRPAGQCSQCRVDARQYRHLQHYYEAVLSLLEPQDAILILGPDQAKRELLQRIEVHQGARGKVVGIHDASRLSEVDLVYPTGEDWRPEDGSGAQEVALTPEPAPEIPGILGRLP